MNEAIVISYRREDSEGEAGRLYDDLGRAFGKKNVFMDVTGIPAGCGESLPRLNSGRLPPSAHPSLMAMTSGL